MSPLRGESRIRGQYKLENLFSIGEVASMKGVTIKALRYYHQTGILIPVYIDTKTGYRYYSVDQFVYIDIIKVCRALGTSTKELQNIFTEKNMDELLKFLALKREETEQKIKEMQAVIHTIDKLDNSVQVAKKVLVHNQITIQYFEQRYIVTAPCKEVGNFKEFLYYSDVDKIIQERNLETTMEIGIAYSIHSKYRFEPKYAFSVLCKYDYTENEQNIDILPEGNYLTLAYKKNNKEESMEKLKDYIEKNNVTIKNCIEVELLDEFFSTDSYSCQMQLLIENE